MYNAFPSLSPFYAASVLSFVLNSICDAFSLVLILATSKVVRFHNEAQTFLYQKIGTNFLILP